MFPWKHSAHNGLIHKGVRWTLFLEQHVSYFNYTTFVTTIGTSLRRQIDVDYLRSAFFKMAETPQTIILNVYFQQGELLNSESTSVA